MRSVYHDFSHPLKPPDITDMHIEWTQLVSPQVTKASPRQQRLLSLLSGAGGGLWLMDSGAPRPPPPARSQVTAPEATEVGCWAPTSTRSLKFSNVP